MEIQHCYIYFSCCVIITYLEAKSVSLNDIIAAERQIAQHTSTSTSTSRSTLALTGKKTLPLKYRQTFEIESPTKPNKYKISLPRHKRKKFTKKREIIHNGGIIHKYIPLLKNLRLLVDNILTTESSETYKHREKKFKRNYAAIEKGNIGCTCGRRSNSEYTSDSQETNTSTAALSTEVQNEIISLITTTAPPDSTVNDNVRGVGRDKNIPVLSARNSTSFRRNYSRLSERSGSSFNGSFEGHITGYNGDNERNTGKKSGPHTENYPKYTNSYTRDDAGGHRLGQQSRGFGIESRDTELNRRTSNIKESTYKGNETLEDVTRQLSEYQRENEYNIRRDETESSSFVSKLASRLRGFDTQEKDTTIRKTENEKESIIQISTSHKRIPNRNSPFASENQEISTKNTAITPKRISPISTYPLDKVVMIFDGYSVAKDVNGNNKLMEQAVQVHI